MFFQTCMCGWVVVVWEGGGRRRRGRRDGVEVVGGSERREEGWEREGEWGERIGRDFQGSFGGPGGPDEISISTKRKTCVYT